MRNLLGGKGANLAEMTNLGLPVPQGFTISTEACTQYYEDGKKINDEIQAQIMELMKKLQQEMGTSILLITHDMGVIADAADSVLVMYGGDVMEYADVRTIFLKCCHPYTEGLLSSIPRSDQDTERLYSIEGVVPPLAEMPEGCRFSTRCPYATERCKAKKPSLFDVGNGHLVRCFKAQEEASV